LAIGIFLVLYFTGGNGEEVSAPALEEMKAKYVVNDSNLMFAEAAHRLWVGNKRDTRDLWTGQPWQIPLRRDLFLQAGGSWDMAESPMAKNLSPR